MEKQIASAVRRTPQYNDAIRCYEDSVRANPDFAPSFARLAYYRALGGQFQQALEAASALIALVPLCSDAYSLRARAYQGLGINQLSRKDFEKAVELNPRDPSLHLSLGIALSNSGDHIGAIRSYLTAAAEEEHFSYYMLIAEEYRRLGDYEKARSYLALALDGGMPQHQYDAALKRIHNDEQ